MGKRSTKVTDRDVNQAGGIEPLVKKLVHLIKSGDGEAKESSAASLRSFAAQNHGEHRDVLIKAKVVIPLVQLLINGSAKAQESSSGCLYILAQGQGEVQKEIVDAGGIPPLVQLLKTGSAKVQEEAASALAAIDTDLSHQAGIIKAGAIMPLVAMLKTGSAAAQAFAAQAVANAAAFSHDAQQIIAKVRAKHASNLGALMTTAPIASKLARGRINST